MNYGFCGQHCTPVLQTDGARAKKSCYTSNKLLAGKISRDVRRPPRTAFSVTGICTIISSSIIRKFISCTSKSQGTVRAVGYRSPQSLREDQRKSAQPIRNRKTPSARTSRILPEKNSISGPMSRPGHRGAGRDLLAEPACRPKFAWHQRLACDTVNG